MLIRYGRKLNDLVLQSISNDENTYVDESEKEFVLSLVKHFFDEYNWNNFGEFNLDRDTYNKYYRDIFLKFNPSIEKDYIQILLKDSENEIK